MKDCPPESVEEYQKWIAENAKDINDFVKDEYPSNAYCPEGPQVNLTGASKPPTVTIEKPVDPVEDLKKLKVVVARMKQEECNFLTKQFLARLKQQGCTGVSCSGNSRKKPVTRRRKPCKKKKKRC